MYLSQSKKPLCPSRMILRESYLSKSGKRVNARCIRKTGMKRDKSSNRTLQLLNNMKKRSLKASKMSIKMGLKVPKKCPKGMILRSGYIKKSYTRNNNTRVHSSLTAPKCIKQQGIIGKKTKAIILDDHYLSENGYHNITNMTSNERLNILKKIISDFTITKGEMIAYNYVIKALNARYILNRNTNPKVAKLFKQDQRTISKIYKRIKQTN